MTLRLNGSTSGYTELDAPAVAGNNNIKLPASNGSANNLLKNSGTAGTLEFASNVNIDSSGRLLVGTSSSSATLTAVLQGNSAGAANSGVLGLCIGSATPTDGSNLGRLIFGDNTHAAAAQVSAQRDGGTWSASSKPSRLVFSTTADGASSPTERMRIRADGNVFAPQVYNNTTASAANGHVFSDGALGRSTSSAKYKTNIETIEESYSDALLNVRPVWYRSTCETDNPNFGWWGFIAEEVAQIDPRLVHWKTTEVAYDENGSAVQTPCEPEPEGVQYDRFVPHLLNLIKRQGEAIAELQAEVAALKAS